MGKCIEFKGAKNDRGYGQRKYKGKTMGAHRAAYIETHGEIPEGLVVMHSCDNPPCVNLDHLSLGTRADNNADMAAKGRSPRGENHVHSILTEDNVRTARALKRYGVSIANIARLFKCERHTMGDAIRGKNWAWVT